MRRPSDKAHRRLFILGNGAIVVTPGRKDWEPLLRRGLVEIAWEPTTKRRGVLPPLRITPAGLGALADWFERVGPLPLPRRERETG